MTSTDTDSPTAARRKAEIAQAARAELLEKGFEGLRMRAVADRCGINVATLDYHVGGKDGLIALVAQSLVEDFRARTMGLTCPAGLSGCPQISLPLATATGPVGISILGPRGSDESLLNLVAGLPD